MIQPNFNVPRNFETDALDDLIDTCIDKNVVIGGVRLLTKTASLARNRPDENQHLRYVNNTNHRIMVEFGKIADLGQLETAACYVANDAEEVLKNHIKIKLRCRNNNMLAKEAT